MDHLIDTEPGGLEDGLVRGVIRIPQTGDHCPGPQLPGHLTGNQVDLINTCQGQEDVGAAHLGLGQHRGSGAVPLQCAHIEGFTGTLHLHRIDVYEGNIMIFLTELFGQVEPNLTSAYNYDLE
ncbi:hypothetical protein ES707_18290 [subsurface metagenome]